MTRTLLIVDDSKTNRQILHRILRTDYSFLEAENGLEAMKLLRQEHYRISAVLLDIVMPEMDGYGVLEQMHTNPLLAQIPVIVTTGKVEKNTEKKALALGANDFVQRPFNPTILKRRLHNLISLRETSAILNTRQKDNLTGLWNRESFFERAAWKIKAKPAGHFILSCLDVDNFKVINDKYGTEKGDEVLKSIANILQRDCETDDSLCGRISSDNFVLLYDTALLKRENGKGLTHEIAKFDEFSFPVTISIGRYLVTDETLSVSAMYDRAKIAQKTIKGRSDIHIALYDESMRRRILQEQEIVSDMQTALESHQFEPWFQPQFNHNTGAMIGSEALVRWRHPQEGLIPPSEFIPIFEQNGFVYELDKFVWEEVCRYLRKWLDQGWNPLPVSVNISRADVFHPEMISVIQGLVTKYAIPIDLLRLEITESAFANDSKMVIMVVKTLINMGFTVEIDDFGSGYSSLNTLKDVPAQVLKLDLKFLQNRGDSQRGGNIVSSVVRMSKWLGMSVIAEGVEEKEQADYLCSIGCSYIQGFYCAKPMPVNQYENYFRNTAKEEHLIQLETVENLDNNSFWDPKSMDTLIFNSYIGGACIVEYYNDKIEVLRVNKKYAQELGGPDMTEEAALNFDLEACLDAANHLIYFEIFRTAIETNEEVSGEMRFRGVTPKQTDTWISATVRVIARADTRVLLYCTIKNTTLQREAEQAILAADGQIKFLNQMSHELLAFPDVENGIHSVLVKLMAYFQGDRAYIFEIDYEGSFFSNTYEVCAEGVSAEINNLQNLDITFLASWLQAFEQKGFIAIPEISKLDDSRSAEREILMAQNIRSLFSAPLWRDGTVIGLIGIDNPRCELDQIDRFAALGDYIAIMLTRRDLNASISNYALSLSNMMNDMPGGFARMRLTAEHKMETVYVNEPFCRMRGLSPEQIYEQDGKDAIESVFAEDRADVQAMFTVLIKTGDVVRAQYRLNCCDGSTIPVNVLARLSKNSNGETFINAYFTDMSAEEKYRYNMRDMLSNTLSAIMQASNDYAFAKDKDLHFICCSPAILELAGLTSQSEVVGKTDFDLFPKDMAESFTKIDRALLAAEKPFVDFNETITTRDGAVRHCLTSKYILRDKDGSISGLYGVSRDITEERSALKRLQLLNDSLPGGIATYQISPTGYKTTYFNDGFCKMLGCTREEYQKLLSDGVTARVFPEDLPNVNAQIRRLYEDGTPINCTYRNNKVHGDGYIWINMRGVITERNGNSCSVNTVLYDVTEQQEAQRQERITSHRMKIMMDNINSGIRAAICDKDTLHYLFANDRFYQIQGYTREQYAAEVHDPYSVIHSDDRDWVKEQITDAVHPGDTKSIDFRIILRTGEMRWVRAAITVAIFEEAVQPVQLSIYSDVTVEKEQDEQQGRLLDNLPYGVALYEFDGQHIRVIHRNKRYWELVERQPKDMNKIAILDAVYPDDRELVTQELMAAIQQKRNFSADIRILRGTSEYKPFHITGNITTKTDGNYLIYSVYSPLSEQEMSIQDVFTAAISGIVENSRDIVFVKDAEMRYVSCSKVLAKIAGIEDQKDMIGKTDADFLPSDIAAISIETDRLVLEKGEMVLDSIIALPYAEDGLTHYASTSKYPLLDPMGKIVGIYGMGRDVTQTYVQESQLQLINDSVPCGLAAYVFTKDKVRLEYFNDGFPKLFGSTRERITERGDFDPMDWIFDADKANLKMQNDLLLEDGTPSDCTFRIHTLGGGYKWIHYQATASERNQERALVNALLLDVTDQREMMEQLRISEEENAYAVQHGGNIVYRYNIANRVLKMDPSVASAFSLPSIQSNVPDEPIQNGLISPETADVYRAFFEKILRGQETNTVLFRQRYRGDWRWMEAKSSIIFADDGRPAKAVISMFDVSDRVEKETVYKRWQQSLDEMPPESHTLFRINLNRDRTFETKEGDLILFDFASGEQALNERSLAYTAECVFIEDQKSYIDFVNREILLANYLSGKRSKSLEYRENQPNDNVRWLRLTIDLVESPDSSDVEAFFMYEDIDQAKRDELETKALSETDPLTGLLNRAAFTSKVDQILSEARSGTKHALLMLDIDGFKQVNDVFGHEAGDLTLIELANNLRHVIRENDLIARLGGDEFMVFLSNIHSETPVIDKAQQICDISRKTFDQDVKISTSVGIVFSPRDGKDFAALYKKVDVALYFVKGSGKDNVSVYNDNMANEQLKSEAKVQRLRITSAVSRSENERLQASNLRLTRQNNGHMHIEQLMTYASAVFIEYDWTNQIFTYYPSISNYLAGNYDNRPFWQILLADMVADTPTVQKMQELFHRVATNKEQLDGGINVMLSTPLREKHNFHMSIHKQVNDFQIAKKIIITLTDMDLIA